jgi:hypothetical protein
MTGVGPLSPGELYTGGETHTHFANAQILQRDRAARLAATMLQNISAHSLK